MTLDTFRDPVQNIDNRISLAASLGRRFWEHTHGLLTSELGFSQLFETLTSESEFHPALRWALDYKKIMEGGKLEAFHNHRMLTIPEDDRGFVLDSSSGIRFLVSKRLDVNMRVDAHHESMPAPERQATDITYVAWSGIVFLILGCLDCLESTCNDVLQLEGNSLKSPPSNVSPSSSGLGHWVFIPATGVRLP